MHIDLIGVPTDYGAGRRGVDMGPSAIRYAGLCSQLEGLGHTVSDLGNLETPLPEMSQPGDPKLRHADAIVAVAQRVADRVEASLSQGQFPLTLGGDHSLALGSIHGAARVKKIGLIWFDAHGDFNTCDTSPSGNIHGMPLAALAGFGDPAIINLGRPGNGVIVDPANIAVVGARDLDEGERELLRQTAVTVLATEQIDRIGMYRAMQQAIEIATRGTDGIYLSLDLGCTRPGLRSGSRHTRPWWTHIPGSSPCL